MLVAEGHDVLSAIDVDRRASDEALMSLALAEGRILITEDKDFGELVFVRRLPFPCIVRLVEMPLEAKVNAVRKLIEDHPDDLREWTLVVVTASWVRIRRVEPFSRN